ncbi:MAG: bifunctional 4-hydroxy-2-oxoglutarate aldolase/2-dehydro-3-deoxy-phosphogluconate aldolase [Lachnospiraceae bacterium]|nr:bifunctional 4-hydroxy-2-oxoglutarate aldolase/2-dehydro-3-deoxy-phosphogluconate aldolase [Lachnospiraceae bacterium]
MKSQFPQDKLERLSKGGAVAVLILDKLESAVPLAKAIWAGGINAMELTLRTPVALEALKAIRAEVPEMLAGVGTILTPEQVKAVYAAGADFGVAPGLNESVVKTAQDVGLPFAPGVMTPSEIEKGVVLGCRELKLFPAELSGGVKYMKSVAAPYEHLGLRYMPLGGLTIDTLGAYFATGLTLAVGGSWIAPRATIQEENWAKITENARKTREAIDQARAAQ